MLMLKVLAAVAVLAAAAVPSANAAESRCGAHPYKVLHNHSQLTKHEKRLVDRYIGCADAARAKALRELRHKLRAWRMSYAHVWPIRLNTLPDSWVAWAKMITFRESRWDQHACDYVSCTHYSYFQWALSTWYDAGGTGHPYNASWPHQAVLAIRYAQSGHLSAWALTN